MLRKNEAFRPPQAGTFFTQMRLVLIILMVGFVMSVSAYAGIVGKSDKEENRLKGPVQSVWLETERSSTYAGQRTDTARLSISYEVYDTRGYLVEFAQSPSASQRTKFAHTYDAEGRLIEIRTVAPNGGVTSYTYVAIGDMMEKRTLSNTDHSITRRVEVYDKKNNLRETRRYYSDGAFANRDVLHYNSIGQITDVEHFDDKGNLLSRRNYQYDDKGKERQMTDYSADGSVEAKKVTVYDAQGNESQTDYNSKGEITEKITRSYAYDSQGNWIRKILRTQYLGEKPYDLKEVSYRTITYYPASQTHETD